MKQKAPRAVVWSGVVLSWHRDQGRAYQECRAWQRKGYYEAQVEHCDNVEGMKQIDRALLRRR